ncbi:MAG TPA: hypothetical protein VGC41_24130 [Kofleriaceae bacterium]
MIAIHGRGLGKLLVEAWHRELAGIASVRVRREGQLSPRDPIDVKADAGRQPGE